MEINVMILDGDTIFDSEDIERDAEPHEKPHTFVKHITNLVTNYIWDNDMTGWAMVTSDCKYSTLEKELKKTKPDLIILCAKNEDLFKNTSLLNMLKANASFVCCMTKTPNETGLYCANTINPNRSLSKYGGIDTCVNGTLWWVIKPPTIPIV